MIFRLDSSPDFPPVHLAEADGLLAVGGDLSVKRLVRAYEAGIFPWFSEGDPILWWAPDPRYVLQPERLRIPRSMRPLFNRRQFAVSMNRAFDAVIAGCAGVPRRKDPGTWITPGMQAAYSRLHAAGYAHSVEVWQGGQLVGGLYGICRGTAFFGESMFTLMPNASKYGFISLVLTLQARGFTLIDCQVPTDHLARFGAEPVPRAVFMDMLAAALTAETPPLPSDITPILPSARPPA